MAIRDLELHVNVTGDAEVKLPQLDNQMQVFANSTYTATTSAAGFNMAWSRAGQVIGQTDERLKTMTQTNLRATYTMFQMNQVVRDLPFGFIAISNNLPMLYDQFMMLSRSAGGTTMALKAIGAAIFSPSGIAVAVSGLISLLTVFAVKNMGATKVVEEFTLETVAASTEAEKYAKSLEGVRDELEKLTNSEVLSRLDRMNETLAEGVEELDVAMSMQAMTQWGVFVNILLGNDPDDALKKIKEATGAILEANDVLGGKRSKIGNLKNQIKSLEDTRYNFPEGTSQSNYDAINERIKMAQDELDKLLGKVKTTHKALKDLFSDSATSNASGDRSGLANNFFAMANNASMSFGRDATRKMNSKEAGLAMFSREYTDAISMANNLSSIGAEVLENNYTEAWRGVFGEANSLFEQYASRIIEFFASDLFTDIALTFTKWALTAIGQPELAGLVTAGQSGGNSSSGDRSYYLVVNEEVIGKFVDKRLPQSINRNEKLGMFS